MRAKFSENSVRCVTDRFVLCVTYHDRSHEKKILSQGAEWTDRGRDIAFVCVNVDMLAKGGTSVCLEVGADSQSVCHKHTAAQMAAALAVSLEESMLEQVTGGEGGWEREGGRGGGGGGVRAQRQQQHFT